MNDFHKALLWTVIPIIILCIGSMIGVASEEGGYSGIFNPIAFLWAGAVIYFIGGVNVLIISAAIHKREIASGIIVGLGIGIVSLGVSCFANNALSSGYLF